MTEMGNKTGKGAAAKVKRGERWEREQGLNMQSYRILVFFQKIKENPAPAKYDLWCIYVPPAWTASNRYLPVT